MKAFLMCSLAVMLLAGVANAANPTMWLADKADGDGHIVMMPSETAVIQLWLEVFAPTKLINADAILRGYDHAWGTATHFDVQGFNDIPYAEPDWYRVTRGAITVPHGDIDDYQYVGDSPPPWTGTSGIQGPAVVLLDEIIIHCTGPTDAPDMVTFAFGGQAPGGFELNWRPVPPPGSWWWEDIGVDLLNGTLANPFLVGIPEPATLSLLGLGTLLFVRRQARQGWAT